MTDRGRGALSQSPDRLGIGASSLHWDGTRLHVEIDEGGAPPRFGRVRGRITVEPRAVTGVELPLTPDGAHVWRPFAPAARISVSLDLPGWDWEGEGYLDGNFGTRPFERDFDRWTWGRFPLPDGAAVFYEAERTGGPDLAAAMRFREDGTASMMQDPPPVADLPGTLWRLKRWTRCDPGAEARVETTQLDAPFYARSTVRTRIDGHETTGMHEAIDMRRWASPVFRPMIAMRVPRRRG